MRSIPILLVAGSILALPLAADTITYTYTGNDFEVASGPYTTSDFVSGFFTLTTALGDNLVDDSITPASYSFSDGVQTFSSSSPPSDVTFDVSTNSSGAINGWFIDVGSGANFVSTATTPNQEDQGEDGFAGAANNFFAEGTWVQTESGGGSAVPEPSNVGLVGLGLLAMAVVVRRRVSGARS